MSTYRGLLTDREREILRGDADVSRNYVYQIRSRVREKIDRLEVDMEILADYHPELLEDLRAVVCEETRDET